MSHSINSLARVSRFWIVCACLVSSAIALAEDGDRLEQEHGPSVLSGPVHVAFFDRNQELDAEALLQETSPLRQATMLQPTPFLEPRVSVMETPLTTSTDTLASSVFSDSGLDRSVLRQAKLGVDSLSVDLVSGAEAGPLVSTDVGDLLRKSPSALSVDVQARTPVVNDPRIRSSRIGSLAASGSHWVPARADLDTALSKIDSRMVKDVIIVPGPYSSVYGPGFNFVDFELLQSPRFDNGPEMHGRSSFDHKSNGNQWLGAQGIWGGGENWGYRGNYSHRTGSNYRAGDGSSIPSSYESRELTLAFGRDFRNNTSIELSLLRLDQTDVEFPGYVFDIDALVTDGYEVAFIDSDPDYGDRVATEVWYNRTRFSGGAQNPEKRAQFPLLNRLRYVGVTDVDSLSTGYRQARTWGTNEEEGRLVLGHDLRFIKQELNEISNGTTLGLPLPLTNRNSPIPRSFAVNPGLFAEYTEQVLRDWTFKTGARVDYMQTDIVDDQAKLDEVGLDTFPASFEEILGTDVAQTDRVMWSLYGSLTRQVSDKMVTSSSLGYAQRAPNLTELYAAQPFLLLLQNGLNNVTGDPTLKREQWLQTDMSIDFNGDNLRYGIRGFYGWGFDYITFENTSIQRGPPNGDVQQVSLRYVNTALATMAGFESFAELFPQKRTSPFVSMRYVDGRDRTRNGDFATTNGQQGVSSAKIEGQQRGFFSGLVGGDSEPLPGISPLETKIGLRLRDDVSDPKWNVEIAARIVDNQDRVATSLLETPTAGFTTYDIRGTFRPEFSENLVIVGGVENFTDKTYRDHLDFRSLTGIDIFKPGVNFYVGADLTY
ncbi:MAG: TonB-dependent receptor [Rubripirellula sp.]